MVEAVRDHWLITLAVVLVVGSPHRFWRLGGETHVMKRASFIVLLLMAAAVVPAQQRHVEALEPSALVSRGQRLFKIQGCYGCHMVGKFGTPIGPDLSNVGGRLSRSYLERWISDPESQRPHAHMPKLELEAEDVTALAAYLSSLR